MLVPSDAFEERIDEADQDKSRRHLRIELRPLGNAAGDDRRDGGGEGQQKEELDQFVAAVFGQRFRAGKELSAIGDANSR